MEEFRRTYAAPGARAAEVSQPAPAIPHESKRQHALVQEDDHLVDGMQQLDEQTRAKNREFRRRINDLITRRKRAALRLQEEVKERTDEIERMRADFEESTQRTTEEMLADIDAEFDKIERESYQPLVAYLERMKKDFDRWALEDVPAVIEAETGQVVRYLSQTRESFDIENAKIRKREEKLEERFAAHRENAAFLAEAEAEKRADRFWALEEDIAAEFARISRRAPKVENRTKHAIARVRDGLRAERAERAERDVTVLSTLTDSMAALQKTVLDNFGANSALQE